MDPELIKQEIKNMLEHMTFGEELESIETHQGTASRFSVRIRNSGRIWSMEENPTSKDGSRPAQTNLLIGECGNNLAALEHLLKKIIRKKYGEDFKFTLDVNDYRMKRLEDLKQDVKAAAKEVRLYKKEVPLRPMSSFERRIVHLLLAEYPDIITESVGGGLERRVVIKPYP